MKLGKYIKLAICLFLAALNFNLFLKPLKLVTGGTQGLAILINNFIMVKPSIIILIINIIALLISYFFLTKDNTKSALLSTFLYPLFVRLTESIPSFATNNSVVFYAIIAGIVCGVTGGFIYKLGFSSGGITVINLLCKQYLNVKVSIANFVINTFIIIIGCFKFGIVKAIYSIIVILISSLVIYFILRKPNEFN